MAKRARVSSTPAAPPGAVGPRQPCPCGSGRRYKACHGGADGSIPYVTRSFEGLPGECDWVAMREFVPVASAALALRPDAYDGSAAEREVLVATVLPGVSPALVRQSGAVWLAVQVTHQSGDPSRDLAAALGLALAAPRGEPVVMATLPPAGARLQDVVEVGSPFEVTVHDGFDFWFEEADASDTATAATLEQLNSSIDPTVRLKSVDAAYWTSVGTKEHLRWVLPLEEEALLTGLARLHVAGADRLTPESRLVGSFRAHGLLVPVWDLPVGTGAEAIEEPAATFATRLADALAIAAPLSTQERAARNGLATRQLTIR